MTEEEGIRPPEYDDMDTAWPELKRLADELLYNESRGFTAGKIYLMSHRLLRYLLTVNRLYCESQGLSNPDILFEP